MMMLMVPQTIFFFLIDQRFVHLIIVQLKMQLPDPIAILNEIKSVKFVEKKSVNNNAYNKAKIYNFSSNKFCHMICWLSL